MAAMYKAEVSPPPKDAAKSGGVPWDSLDAASLSVAMKEVMVALTSLKDEVFTHNAKLTFATAYRYTFNKT